jgi:hypothetical protein
MKHIYAFTSVCSRYASNALMALIFTTAFLLSGTEAWTQCNNVTYGGSIGSNQTGNVGYNPSMFLNVTSPSGGSGTMEYMWLYKNSSTDWQFLAVTGANSATYDSPALNETTTFRRCARRSGCSSWDGESNDCTVTINCTTCNNLTSGGTIGSNQSGCSGFDPDAFTNIASPSGGSGALEIIWMYWNASTNWNMTVINGATGLTYDPGMITEDTYFRRCARRQGCSNYDGESNDVFIDITGSCSNVTYGGTIGSAQSGCVGYDPSAFLNVNSPSGGSGTIEYMWLYKNASTGWVYQTIVGANGATYDSPALTETTTFRRCARRSCCSSWPGESNEITVTINCQPCNNLTNGGTIGYNQSGCTGFDAAEIVNVTSPSGGSGNLEIIWMYWNASTGWNMTQVSGATGLSYDPGLITEDTYFRRCARREGCSSYVGESNDVFIDITECCNATIDNVVIYNTGSGTSTPLVSGTEYNTFNLPSNWNIEAIVSGSTAESVVFDWSGSYTSDNTQNAYPFRTPDDNTPLNLGPGTYTLTVKLYSQDNGAGLLCDEEVFNFTIQTCSIFVNAGEDRQLCGNQTITLTSTVSGVSTCTTGSTTDCNHSLAAQGGWLESPSNSTVCGDNAGTKLWTQSGQGTSYIVLDMGTELPAGTLICTNMKLEHCSGTSSNYSNAKIQASTSANSGFGTLVSSVTFTHTNYQEYCYTLASPARYIKVSDNGNCAFRVDYVEYTTPVINNNSLTYSWSGPGIVGANNGASVQVNQTGVYTVTVTDCNGCTDTDEVIVHSNGCCELDVVAGPDQELCYPQQVELTSTITGASICQVTGTSDCNHTLAAQGGWLESPSNSTVCGDNAGTKLWTQSGQGTSYIVLDMGVELPAGTQICANMKLEHCSGTGTNYSNAKIQASTSSNSGFTNLTSSVTFSQTSYQEFCYTLSAPARYIKVSDNGNCAFRVDYLKYTTQSSGNNAVTYSWSGPGIVGANNGANVIVNMPGTYTVTVTDCNGCTDSDTVIVTADDVPPVFDNQPSQYEVNCGQDLPMIQPTATDNNGFVNITYTDSTTCTGANPSCNCVRIRIWTASDNCGNTALFYQYFNVIDNVDPVFNNAPQSGTYACDEIPSVPNVTASDNCDDMVAVDFTQTQTEGCPYVITRTWTASDDCGNSITHVQTINVIDNEYPVLVGVPANLTLECDQMAPEAVVNATDNCTEDLVVSLSATTDMNDCGWVFTRTWSVTDDCGNTTTGTQVINFVDTTDPIVTQGVPAELTIECDQPEPMYMPEFADNCDDTLSLTAISGINNVNACGYDIERSWTATDDCGNSTTVSQIIHVRDTTDPVLVNVPADATVECDAIPAPANVTATDNCSAANVSFSQTATEGCPYTITRTWTATDECGNSTTDSQILTVVDTHDPIIVSHPEIHVTIECGLTAELIAPVFSDNCDLNLDIDFNEVEVSGGCVNGRLRTWTATDNCGNATTFEQIITIVDTTDPVFDNLPMNTTVQCDAVPAVPVVTASDICDSNVEVTFSEVSTEGCPYTITRTWTATDECDNVTVGIQVINVIDTTYPVLYGVPADATLECDQMAPEAVVTATDNCSENLVVSLEANTDMIDCGWVFTRTWSVSDDCGNTTTATQVINFVDTTDPIVTQGVPASLQIECDQDAPFYMPTFSDNCDDTLAISAISGISNVNACGYDIERAWTATDDCGNSTTVYQVIYVRDTTDPILVGVPANDVVECDAIPAPAVVTATDNCSTATVEFAQTSTQGCPYIITRTWTATDECGNETVASQVLTVVDTTDPILVGVPADAQVECSAIPAPAVVTATDNCDQNMEVGYYEQFIPGNDCFYTLVRHWEVTDDCGNMVSANQVLYVTDTTYPELVGVPANVTVECDAIPAAALVSGTDNCDTNVAVTMTETQTEGCPYTITRTWTGVDNCGNDVSASQIISVIDTTFPVLHGVPANTTLECDQMAPEAVVTATDNCSENLVVSLEASTDMNDCGYVFTRTWSVSDDCGNTTTATQVINFVDTTDPIVTQGVPASLQIECDQDAPFYMPTFSDNCDDSLTVTAISGISNVNACGYDIERAWTATDDCGNSTTVYQVIYVRDTTDPILVGVPANDVVECDAIPAPAVVTATDNCSTATVEFAQTSTQGCPYIITRTWTATDECGNESVASQVLTVVDTTDPILVGVPADAQVECSAIPAPAVVTATDNCDQNMEVGYYEQFIPGNECFYTLVRHWEVTDDCGNMVSANQVLYVTDTTDPELVGVPTNVTVECDAIPAAALVSGTDNCDTNVAVTMTETQTEGCPYTITRTWTGVDNCGNDVSASQIITVIDTTFPVLYGVPANTTLECDQIAPAAVVTATDNCTEDLNVQFDSSTQYNACGFVMTRTWSVADACGNTTTASQVINFVDTTDPIVTQGVPASLQIECDQDAPFYMPTFSDNCDDSLTVTAISGISNVNACGYDIERAWTATDDCGNSTTVYQVIYVRDTTDPILVNVPANDTVECSAIPAPANVTATDNCSTATVEFAQTSTQGCPYTITRTWTATDACGNQSVASQVLTVVDTTDPILVGVPADAQVECSAIPAPAAVTATDNCDQNMEVGYYEQFIPGNDCFYTLVRHWEVTDDCGNMASANQVLYVTDTTDPELVGVPANVTVECDAIPAAALVSGTDNCDTNVAVTMTETQTEGCPYTITRTWTGVDNCGNDVSASQIITVIDTTFPVLFGVPANTTLECDQTAPEAVVTATDNCTEDLNVQFDSSTQYNACGFVMTRTWSVADACGNTTTASQVINFVDTTDPIVTQGVPASLQIECDQDAPYYMPSFSDNCDDSLTVTAISGISNLNACGYDIERAWTATDDCGNSTTVYQVIYVRDTTDPILVNVPANDTVECSAIPAPANVTATDNCSIATVVLIQTSTEGCPYTITRTWTATDECGNETVASQVLTVVDTTDPILVGVPADAQVECSAIPAPAVVTATDNCDQNMEVGYYEQFIPGNDCFYTLVRHWEVTDDCGNMASANQVLYVTDTTDPELVGVPANVTVECDEVPAAALVSGTDNCDTNVAVTMTETQTEGCSYTIIRTWTGVDNCGNDVSASQIITVVDTTFPVLYGVPANTTLECDQTAPEAVVTATDNCTDNLVVSLEASTDMNDCGYVFTRTWSVSDACGNTTTATQVINFVDTTDPIVTQGVPAELTIECDQDAPYYMPSFSDNCDDSLTVTAISGISNVNPCGYDIERAWTATDDCGNSKTVYQVIHVVDTTNPVLVGVPANAEVECDAVPAPADVTATDNCSEPAVVMVEVITEGCPYTITRTWTATDDCGNQDVATQVITVVDTEDPYMVNNVPTYYTIECGEDVPVNNPIFADNCDADLTIDFNEMWSSGGCPGTIVRTWVVTDNCGNSIEYTQYIGVHDTTAPTVVSGVPAELTYECDQIIPEMNPTFSDVCDENFMVIPTVVVENETACGYDIVKTWTAIDYCENETVVNQTIHVVDTTDPVIVSWPSDLTLECGQEIPAPGMIEAYDNCTEEVNIAYSADTTALDCGFYIERTWRVTDACGNEAIESQMIYVLDETAPVIFNIPADVTILCNEPVPAPSDLVYATDNCDQSVVVTVVENIIPGSCYYQIKRYYTAVDACGNMTSIPQIITVTDTISPVIEIPADVTVPCSEIPSAPELSAMDNCDDNVAVTFTEVVEEGCPYNIIRTWTATDDCGNTTTGTQVISVYDEVDPIFDAYLPFVEVECDQVDAYMLTATDNCDAMVDIVIVEESQVSGQCYGSLLRTYLATDNCGNTATAFQIIDIVDTTAPVLHNVPAAEATVVCGSELPALPVVTATDNCTEDMVVNFTQTQTNDFCPYDVIRTWTVVDACGNETTATQTIHVIVDVPAFVQVLAYPNPAQGNFTLKMSVPADTEVYGAIYDATGREVVPFFNGKADGGRLYNWSMDSRNFEAGMYTIMVKSGNDVLHERLVISNK